MKFCAFLFVKSSSLELFKFAGFRKVLVMYNIYLINLYSNKCIFCEVISKSFKRLNL